MLAAVVRLADRTWRPYGIVFVSNGTRLLFEIAGIIDFYESLSFGIMSIGIGPTAHILNFDSHVIDSMMGTLQSMQSILLQGRINDAYMLLRKYYDIISINIYEMIEVLEAEERLELVTKVIDDWIRGVKTLPSFKQMRARIESYIPLEAINKILNSDTQYIKLRKRCNDHGHYNYFAYMELNSDIHYAGYQKLLDVFERDLTALITMHFAYFFTLRPFYMSSSDYIDALEMSLKPEPDSQYWVAPFIQKYFDEIVRPNRQEIANELLHSTYMKLS